GGGAGIQADLKTFAAHGLHGASVITALTAQNTRGVRSIHVPDLGFLREQLAAVFEDLDVVAVKLGMLANAGVIECVADALERYAPAHVVLDPVMVATSGARLLDPGALHALRQRLFPLASLLTPNLPEAELLLGRSIPDAEAAEAALTELLAAPARAVLLKGGHLESDAEVVDRLGFGTLRAAFVHPRLSLRAHGTGCTLASAIAANLARGTSLQAACEAATDYVHRALLGAYFPGTGGLAVLDHSAPSAR
ncbi:MAG TPA: bifunctional hydroxymethylpyrimidine kinase/phosphomethylpyrimidine kinase, partial [Polyangiales bacterium]